MTKRRQYGAVRKLPSGRWQARYRDQAGRLVAAPATFDTKGDASRWLAVAESDMARGKFIDPRAGKVLFRDYAARWVEQRTLRPSTADEYRGLVERKLKPEFGALELAKITPSAVRDWNATLSAEHPATGAKSYRLLRAILNTAVDDELIGRNPCRVKGAGIDRSPERPTATVAEVAKAVDAMPPRLRAAVLLAAFCGLRRGEITGLRRRDVDLLHASLVVVQSVVELSDGSMVVGPPKTDAGRRKIAMPPHVARELRDHLAQYVVDDADALVFTGERGGPLRPRQLGAAWRIARLAAGRPDLRLHDLRHTSNTWAAATGASLRELMSRMGHASPVAALRYQHATEDRDRVIAKALGKLAEPAPVTPISRQSGTRVARAAQRRQSRAG